MDIEKIRVRIMSEAYDLADRGDFEGYNAVKVMCGDVLESIAAVVAAEREACAELAVKGTDEPVQTKTLEILRKERERIAAAIRARGEQ
jgi:Iap family predicted aminopeptidase